MSHRTNIGILHLIGPTALLLQAEAALRLGHGMESGLLKLQGQGCTCVPQEWTAGTVPCKEVLKGLQSGGRHVERHEA